MESGSTDRTMESDRNNTKERYIMKPNIVTVDTIDGKGIEVDLNEIKDELSLLTETPEVEIPKEFNGKDA